MKRKGTEALRKEFTEVAKLLSEKLGVPVEIRSQGIIVRVGDLKGARNGKPKQLGPGLR